MLGAVSRIEAVGYRSNVHGHTIRHRECLSQNSQHARLDRLASLGLAFRLLVHKSVCDLGAKARIVNQAQKRQRYLVHPRLYAGQKRSRIGLDSYQMTKTEMKQAISQCERFVFEGVRLGYRNILAHGAQAHVFSEEAALQRRVIVAASHGDDLGAEHAKRARIELLVPVLHGAKYRQPLHIAVVQDFHDLAGCVAETEIGFVQNQCAAEPVESMEYGRDG